MADDASPLASLSLTHVYYDPSDPISYACAFLALVPQALCVVYATLLWSTREAEVALLFAGQLACEAANFALKRLIREERPHRIAIRGKGYGMPSSHAQFVAFWAVALALFLLVRHQPRPREWRAARVKAATVDNDDAAAGQVGGEGATEDEMGKVAHTTAAQAARKQQKQQLNGKPALLSTLVDSTNFLSSDVADLAAAMADPHRPWSLAERGAVSVLALLVAAAVAWSRVYLGYHTGRQVAAGFLAGAVCAVAWFGATHVLRATGLLAWALDLPPARWCRVRDLVVEEDLAQAGWEKWEERMRQRRRTREQQQGKVKAI